MTLTDDASRLLTIRVQTQAGQPAAFRAEIHMSTETSYGTEYTVNVTDPGEVLDAVRAWLGQVRGDGAAAAKAVELPAVSDQEIVYAAWRSDQLDRTLPPDWEWWAVRMEHTPLEQPDGGRMTGAQRLTQTQYGGLLADPHGLARVAYQDPELLLGEMGAGRRFSNMTGWTRKS